MFDVDIVRFTNFLLKQAEGKRYDAGMGGRMDDGGASTIEREVSIFKAGNDGEFPKEWEIHLKDFNKATDPAYEQYLALKERFE